MFEVNPKDDITWLYIGTKNEVFGLHKTSAENMLKMANRGELKNDTLIRPITDQNLHSFGEWKDICAGLNPFLVDVESFEQMEKLTINGKSSRMFRYPHMLLPPNATVNRKNYRTKYYNRAPRKPFLKGSLNSSSAEDRGYGTSCDDSFAFCPPRRPLSSITSNFLATLEDTGARRKSRCHINNLRNKSQAINFKNLKQNNKSVMTEPIVITELQANKILSELLGMDVEIV